MKMNYKKLCQNIINNECVGYENSRMFTQAYTSGRTDTFDEPYYGGGESDWGIDDQPSFFEDDTIENEFIPTDWKKEEEEEKKHLLDSLHEDLVDVINQMTDWEYDSKLVNKMARKEIATEFSKYNSSKLQNEAWREIDKIAKNVIRKISSK